MKKILKILLPAIGAALLCGLFMTRGVKKMQDFEVNHKAGQRIARAETVYRMEDGHYQFKYSPFCAVLYLPLGLLPLPAAKTVWYVLQLISVLMIFILSVRLIAGPRKPNLLPDQSSSKEDPEPPSSPRARWTLWAVPLLVLAKFFLREFELGQINSLITWILVAMIALLAKKRPVSHSEEIAAGSLWGLATAMKPYALIFLPYLAVKKKFKAIFAGLLFLAAAYAFPAAFYGWQGNFRVHQEWRSSLSASTPFLFNSQDNISLVGLFSKWTGGRTAAVAAATVVAILIAGLTADLVRKGRGVARPLVLEGSLLLLLIPLISPLGWDYTLLSSAPAMMLLVKHFRDFPRGWRIVLAVDLAMIAFSFYDLMGRQAYATFMRMSIPTINFLILFGYLAVLRLKEKA